ncbi:MAG: hypothetical protein V2A34_10015, partial [Lentisphaerota bacterium]
MSAWKNFLQLFSHKPAADAADNKYIDVAPEPPTKSAPADLQPINTGNWLARWRPKSRRDAQLASLQAGYAETIELIRSIRLQLENQNEVQQ